MKVKIFLDGAHKDHILDQIDNPLVQGFTTNPSLIKQAGVKHYEDFIKDILIHVSKKPISFEVLSYEDDAIIREGLKLASYGSNVYVKVPIVTPYGKSTKNAIQSLSQKNVPLNITAIMLPEQIAEILPLLSDTAPIILSVFAGRIADTGRDPIPYMKQCLELIKGRSNIELLWASSREVLNIYQSDSIGCHIITCTMGLIKKLDIQNKDLNTYSMETSLMFFNDATNAGFTL